MKTTSAALYLRSSKDRHDLSIDAQRRALHDYAQAQGLVVVAEFADPVETGKDDARPGFQALVSAIKATPRTWTAVIALDTSRIARRRQIALFFEHECQKYGIKLYYKSVPESDPITGMLLRSIFQAMDEWHSLTSKAKGLAGMAESIRQGWRAGGRAPRGYRLAHQPTGKFRDGQPVLRSKLELADDAANIAHYLQARAAGKSRGFASQSSGVSTSLNELEWNALTYAGHTVWGMNADKESSVKRRPRAEWQMTLNTHPAIISQDEAEAILAQLHAKQGRRNRNNDRVYLLSGLLESPDGQPFAGECTRNQSNYRIPKAGRISCKLLDSAVLDQVFTDLAAPETAHQIAERMRALSAAPAKPRDVAVMKRRLSGMEQKMDRLIDLIAEDEDAGPAYRRRLVQLETERATLLAELEEATQARQYAQVAALWTPADVAQLLNTLRESMQAHLAEDCVREVRTALNKLIRKIIYDLKVRRFELHYKLNTGFNVASPRGADVEPVCWTQTGKVLINRQHRN